MLEAMKKIFSIILSLVILFTSMGFTVSSHICGGKRVETVLNIGITDVSCGMENTSQKKCADEKQMKSNCCQDEFQKIQINDNYTKITSFEHFSPSFTIAFVAILVDLLPNVKTPHLFFKNYLPPPLVKDIKVLVQSFLI